MFRRRYLPAERESFRPIAVKLALDLLLLLLSVPLLFCTGYLSWATLLSLRPRTPADGSLTRRFRFVVPAHNESTGIAATVHSLLHVDYPASSFDVLVVADNCSDDTAEQARNAGAVVLERHDDQLRGKGYALLHAFEHLPDGIDAVAVIDADTLVSPNLLRAFSARRELGAHAVQADYAVRNPEASWRTRLIAIAFGSFHIVRSRAREHARLSCGLRGNGMCFSSEILKRVPHNAFSIVEDVEYGVRLGEAGYRVHYADEAHVYGEMVSTASAASSQRRRWEEGRKQLIAQHAGRLFWAGLGRDRVLFDLACDLLIPPLSRLAVLSVVGLSAACALGLVFKGFAVSTLTFAACLASIILYVLRGWTLSGTGARGLLDLGLAPLYVLWKAGLRLRRAGNPSSSWVRTKRENQPGPP